MSATPDQLVAMEALRKLFIAKLKGQRCSFWSDGRGGITRVPDQHGRWVDFDLVHELFDAEWLDHALALAMAEAAIAKAAAGGSNG